MTTGDTGSRVLRFAVTGALLGSGPLACDSDEPAAEAGDRARDQPTHNVMRVEEPPPDQQIPPVPKHAVNPGPESDGADAGAPPDPVETVNEGPVAEPPPETPEPSESEIDGRTVKPAPVFEPTPRTDGRVKPRTNVGRVKKPEPPPEP